MLSTGNRAGAKNYFSVLTHFSPSHKDKIANSYFDMGRDSSLETMLNFYKIALSFSSTIKDKIEAQVIAKLSSGEVGKTEKNAAKPQVKKFVSNDNFKLLYPPKTWQQVGKTRYFTGKGMGEKDYLLTIKCGTDFNLGDKIVVIPVDSDISVFMGDDWNLTSEPFYEIIKHANKGDAVGVRAPNGAKFKTKVLRLL